jgi:predicted metal-dependent phosphoesterase TrpH
MVQADLHLHTTFSDGNLTPTQIVDLCAAQGMSYAAITDHDSTEGVGEALEAARRHQDLELIVGVELSTDVPESEIHLLGYFVDHEDAGFQRTLSAFRDGREGRARRMVERLDELGAPVSWERVEELSGGGAIGRPHIAQAMVEAGYVAYPRDAFDRYLGRNGPAYVERARLTPAEAVRLLVSNGAVPVMAHPTFSVPRMDDEGISELNRMLVDLRAEGLVGMEVYYGLYEPDVVALLKSMADELGLIPCGGSDYHASGNPGEARPGDVGPPASSVEALRAVRADLARA